MSSHHQRVDIGDEKQHRGNGGGFAVTQQPLPGQPGSQHHHQGSKQPLREWSSGVCSCFDDMSNCCLAYWFPLCFITCCLAPQLGESCCAPICLASVGQNPNIAMRAKLRAAHGIQGSLINDCCLSVFCGMCVMCQMKRELDYIQRSTGVPPF